MTNPLTALPPKVRLYAYTILSLAAIALGAYEASQGDWLRGLGYLLGTLGFGTAASNTPAIIGNMRFTDRGDRGAVTIGRALAVFAVAVVVAFVAPDVAGACVGNMR